MKVLGKKKEKTPAEFAIEEAKLILELENLRPYRKPKGVILKFSTWAELDTFNTERVSKQT